MKMLPILASAAALATAPAIAQETPEPRPSASLDYDKQFVEVEGATIAYIETGDPDGAPVLFLHGIPSSSYLWRNVLPGVEAEGRRLIAMDLVGFGDSVGEGYGVLDQVAHLAAFVDALDLEDVTLVTHDWGAGIGLIYAAETEQNVSAFASMEGALPPVYPRETFATFGPGESLFRRMRSPETGEATVLEDNVWVETMLPTMVAEPIQPEVHEAYRAPFPTPESRRPILDMTMSLPIAGEPEAVVDAYTAAAEWWGATDIPKLILYATPGRLYPKEQADWAAANLSNVTLGSVGAGAHFVQEDSPQSVARELDAWLDSIEVDGESRAG